MKRLLVSVGSDGVDCSRIEKLDAALVGVGEVVLSPSDEDVVHPLVNSCDAANLYALMRKARKDVFLARCRRDACEHACRSWRAGDTTILLSVNGTDYAEVIVSDDPKRDIMPVLPPERKIWIGQGTNTWKSDLNLNVRYVRTSGPADAPGATLGIPWMAGIPGSIGGWIKMNAGAFGHSISEMLDSICVDGKWYKADACGFGYRQSKIVGEIQDFRLLPKESLQTEGDADFYLKKRHRFPSGTFGSFFKNPDGDSAGRLLEAAGAKSMRVGGASIWQEHANVIVRERGGTPSDVLALSRLMAASVFNMAGIWLEPEVRM